ncbi:hypothetical protein GCM10011402_29420 [Paracoccus acridae]|uniref:Uncharacterized protein n=1 Tax=Paracoccus acridae TaxID=1795310 RepID=A0ABQ1VK79_9RHOB|nr:hypothetical protein [Paracoccus acridae]GGF74842.1 hypothetical protein GCM10011402_29420 [Paracoccus acridae]
MDTLKFFAPLVFACIIATAPAVQAKNIWDALGLAGSGSLTAWALSEPALPLEALAARNSIVRDMGFIGTRWTPSYTWYRVSPVFTYDGNLNGGFPGSTLVVSGLKFEIGEEYERKSGMLIGAAASVGSNIPVGDGLAWENSVSVLVGWSPEHNLSKSILTGESCLRQMQTIATYLHACLDMRYSDYELGETADVGFRIGASHAFAAAGGLHEVMGEISNIRDLKDRYDQQAVSVVLATAWREGYATHAGLQLGSAVEDQLVMRERVEFGVSRIVLDRPTAVRVSLQSNRGGRWLGKDREDIVASLSLTREVSDNLGTTVSVTKTESSANFFDERSVGFSTNFRF